MKINNSFLLQNSDFLYGANLINKPLPKNPVLLNSCFNEQTNLNNILFKNDNIQIFYINDLGITNYYINFTTDIIYFLAFSSSFIDIINTLNTNENIKSCGFFLEHYN